MTSEGPVSYYLNRRLSRPLARLAAMTPLTPNQVSFLSFLIALAAALLLTVDWPIAAGILIQLSSLVDGIDGDLARLKGLTSPFGAFWDAFLDRYADAAIIAGLAYWSAQHEDWPRPELIGLAALAGSLIISYSRARTEADTSLPPTNAFLGLASRDVRLLLLALGAVFSQAYWTMVTVAVLSGVFVLWRLLYLRLRLPGEKENLH